jgi:hypothetical protein
LITKKTAGAGMGGFGSGRPGSGKATVEQFRKVDVTALERINLNNPGDQQAIGSTLVELRPNGLLIQVSCPALGATETGRSRRALAAVKERAMGVRRGGAGGSGVAGCASQGPTFQSSHSAGSLY